MSFAEHTECQIQILDSSMKINQIMLLSERVRWSINPPINPVTYIHTYLHKSLTCQISLADVNCFLRYFYYMSKHHFLNFLSTECKDLKKTNQVYFRFPEEKQTHLSSLLPCCFTVFTISYFHNTPTFILICRRNIYLANIPVKWL